MGLTLWGGCLELNPEFIEIMQGTQGGQDTQGMQATQGTTAMTAGTSGTGSASTGAMLNCVPTDDLFEPNDVAAPADVELGTHDAALDSATDVDGYKTFVGSQVAVEVFARLDRDDLRVCLFARCETPPTTLNKCQGELTNHPDGYPGCCADGVAALEHVCGGNFDAVIFSQVEHTPPNVGASDCMPYAVELGTNAVQ